MKTVQRLSILPATTSIGVPGNYSNSVTINDPGLTTYVVENLASGTYEFVATAFNAAGMESQYSNSTTKTIP